MADLSAKRQASAGKQLDPVARQSCHKLAEAMRINPVKHSQASSSILFNIQEISTTLTVVLLPNPIPTLLPTGAQIIVKLVTIALRDFAVPAPRAGSLETYSGYGRSAAEGQEIHRRLQRKRADEDNTYMSEVPVSYIFDRKSYRFHVVGRMDGVSGNDPPVIEEIKTCFSIRELASRLVDPHLRHPYCLQLLTYGYLYWKTHGIVARLMFHLVSTRNGEHQDIELALDLPSYEEWLERRLDELVTDTRTAEKRVARRKKTAKALIFPFPHHRPGQLELTQTIEQGIFEDRTMLVQAPTGLGKTVAVLYPVIKDALNRGQKTVYITPKNSQHTIAEEAINHFNKAGAKIKSLLITAKSKICFKNEPLCTPELCEYAHDYYDKISKAQITDILARKKRLKARTFRKLGEKHQVCPFELQFEGAADADIVVCDYNYVFAPRSASGHLTAIGIDQAGKPNLVIDEAHNLPARSMDYYSPMLSSLVMKQMQEEVKTVPHRFRNETAALLKGCIEVIVSCKEGNSSSPVRIVPPLKQFAEQDALLRAFLSRYLAADISIEKHDLILRLCFYWSEFVAALEYAADPAKNEFFTTYHPHHTGGLIKITCCDASAMLQDYYNDFGHVVAFSATLKPFNYYTQLSGLDPQRVMTAEFNSPFPREHRKVMIIPQISTRYDRRDQNYAKIADAIRRITAVQHGNYLVFLPSFDFLEKITSLFQPPEGFTVLRQDRHMNSGQLERILDHLRSQGEPTIVFAVQGGSLAEGVDYAGEMLIGVFVIGPPLPTYDLEREQMKNYYQLRYGAGFDYAYSIPAMAKAVQAAGRVIRSETDRGLIVLMDSRFVEPGYSKAMPADWFESDAIELVSDQILKDIEEFWSPSLQSV